MWLSLVGLVHFLMIGDVMLMSRKYPLRYRTLFGAHCLLAMTRTDLLTSSLPLTRPITDIDDGERLARFVTLLGRAYLTMLNSLDRAGQLKPDSDFKDLALVSGLYMLLPDHFSESYDDEVLDWKIHIGDYMKTKKDRLNLRARISRA